MEAGVWRTLSLAAVAGLLVTASAALLPTNELRGEEEYRSLEELPLTAESVEELEETAIELVYRTGSIPASEEFSNSTCPHDRLEVSWDEPSGFTHGAHVDPVGPAPGPETPSVNGIVVCGDSTYAYAGFEAYRIGDDPWRLALVPSLPEEKGLAAHGPAHGDDVSRIDDPPAGLAELLALDLGPIDDYALYEPQRVCHAVPKPGVEALAAILLTAYPATQNYGIVRDCALGGRSEHKEGRAFDWGAHADDPEQREAAEDFIALLMAEDEDGNEHALARRIGVMYLIWDGAIWASHRADEGWRPYRGPSAHEDHVHISLSWDGAMGRTSLWEAILPAGDLWLALPIFQGVSLPGTGASISPSGTWAHSPSRPAPEPDRSAEDRAAEDDDGSAQEPEDSDDSLTGTVTDSVDDATGEVAETTGDLTDTVDDTTDPVEETVNDLVDEVEETLDPVVDDLVN